MLIYGITSITADDDLSMQTQGKAFSTVFLSKLMQVDRRKKLFRRTFNL